MQLTDISIVQVSQEMLNKAKQDAANLRENIGGKTHDGGEDRDIKGSLGQQAIKELLDRWNIPYEYSETYQEGLYGDEFDLKIYDETYDVKCRSWWSPKYYYNQTFLMGAHEQKKKIDNYIMTTVDADFKNVYVYGAISYQGMWANIDTTPAKNLRFPTAGCIHCREFKPLLRFLLHT